MNASKRGRRPTVRPPPPWRAASAARPPRVTEADLAALAQGAELELANTADVGKRADNVTVAFRRYVIWHRAERAEAGPSEVEEWARGLHRWTADGLVMLGGGLDSEAGAGDFPPSAAAGMQLAHGWPAVDEQLRCDYLEWMAAGLADFSDQMGESPGIPDVIRRCVAAVELIQILPAGVTERAA